MNKHQMVLNQIPMMTNAAKTADINIYGPIVDSSWWSDDVTTPKQIQDKLSSLGDVRQINVHINSPGGSVFAGQAIYNMLRQHPANVTVYVDGLAASIASIIAMAGNKIIMPPGAMMMIHNPLLSLWGTYEASDMREIAGFLDKVKESLVATYLSRQPNKTKDEIVAIMDATTWLTAADALEAGFADEVEGISAVTASMTGTVLNIGGLSFNLSCFEKLPLINSVPLNNNKKKEEGKLTFEELKNKFPELYNQIFQEGVTNERNRQKALDDVQIGGFENLVAKAKYETGVTAEQVAVQIISEQKKQATAYLENRASDVADSNSTQVPATPAPNNKEQEAQEIKAAAEMIAGAANTGRV